MKTKLIPTPDGKISATLSTVYPEPRLRDLFDARLLLHELVNGHNAFPCYCADIGLPGSCAVCRGQDFLMNRPIPD